jgi:hypothetical protein
MNQTTRVLFFLLALSAFGASGALPLRAADPAVANASWGNLKVLSPGEEIHVVMKDAKSYHGEFQSLSDDGLSLRQSSGEKTLARQDILRVSAGAQKHRIRNALIGAAVGAGAGLAIGAAGDHSANNCSGKPPCFGPLFPNVGKEVMPPVGALVGAVVGAVIPTGGWHDIYRAR